MFSAQYAKQILLMALLASFGACAQIAPVRTWPELRDAVIDRVQRNAYPLTGFDQADVKEIMGRIQSLDRDDWANAWMVQGEKYMSLAKTLDKQPVQASEAYLNAWRYFSFGAWPTQNSVQKKKAFERSTQAFRSYVALQRPGIEVLRIPFEGREIVGYLQLPQGVKNPAVVLSIGGLDSYKEFVVEQYGTHYINAKLGYLALDMPGTGEAVLKVDVGAERIFSKVIDHLKSRPDLASSNLFVMGVSWGGHWSARLGFLEKDRLKGAVVWGGPVDRYFDREWQAKALSTKEYLFDLFPARAGVYGVSELEDFYQYGPKMSLVKSGLISKPSTAMLLVNGEKDSQVPIEDLYALLKLGTPKEAWVNPQGGHIGRGAGWPDIEILKSVIVPWLVRQNNALH
ncbi:MAG: alpha/beta hydrolase [Betaproteobacteria bacterium]|jgi:esterase FrsA